jgi:hypothetical protein
LSFYYTCSQVLANIPCPVKHWWYIGTTIYPNTYVQPGFTVPVESYRRAYHKTETTKLLKNMQKQTQA